MESNVLLNIVLGGRIEKTNHYLFDNVYGYAAEKYNEFVDEFDFDENQVQKLQELIDANCAIERLGYYNAFLIGTKATKSDVEGCSLFFEYLGLNKSERDRVQEWIRIFKSGIDCQINGVQRVD